MKIRNILLLITFALVACGGGSGGSTSPVPVPPITTVTNDIVGRWLFITTEDQCVEVYEFKADGRFKILSDREIVTGVYTFEATVEQDLKHNLRMSIQNDNGFRDCFGDYEDLTGATLEALVGFSDKRSLEFYDYQTSIVPVARLDLENSIRLLNFPSQITAGQTVEVEIATAYPSDDVFSVVYGPDTLKIEQNRLTLKPSRSFFSENQVMHAAIESNSTFAPLEFSFTLQSEGVKLPYVAALQASPERNSEIWLGNFDADTEQEVLIASRNNVIALFAYKNAQYIQKAVYPYAFNFNENRAQVRPFDINADGHTEIFVLDNGSLYLIADFTKAPVLLFSTNDFIRDFIVTDLDNDNIPELVFLTSETSDASSTKYVDVKQYNDGTAVWRKATFDDATRVLSGNIDSDSQLELITSHGEVFDGIAGEQQSRLNTVLGSDFVVGDITGDGSDNLVSPNTNTYYTFDSASDSMLAKSLGDTPFSPCAAHLTQLDSDPALEILMGGCFYNDLIAIEIVQGEAVELFYTNDFAGRIHALLTADLNQDGSLEIITRGLYTNSLSVFSANQSLTKLWSSEDDFSILALSAAGYAQVRPGVERGIAVATTSSEFTNKRLRIAQFSTHGDFQTGNAFVEGQNNPDLIDALVFDRAADGFADIAITTSGQGKLVIAEIDADIIDWESGLRQTHIQTFDLDDDGEAELFVAKQNELLILDSTQQTTKLNISIEGYIIDFVIFKEQSNTYIVLNTAKGLLKYRLQNNQANLVASNTDNCTHTIYIAPSTSTACFSYRGGNITSAVDMYDAELNFVSSKQLEFLVTDAINLPNSANIIVGTEKRTGKYTNEKESRIVELEPSSGNTIWQSERLLDTVSRYSLTFIEETESGHPAIMFDTTNAVYLTQ